MEKQIELWRFGNEYYITLQDAAPYLDVSVGTVRHYAMAGRVKSQIFENRTMLEWESVKAFKTYRKEHGEKYSRRRKPITLTVADTALEFELQQLVG